jgi:hypothetical protein
MAEVVVTPVAPLMTGAAYEWTTASSSDTYVAQNSGNSVLLVDNGGGTNVTVTLNRYATFDGDAVANRTLVVAAGIKKAIGLFPTSIYNVKTGANAGKITFSFSYAGGVSFILLAT